MKKSGRFSGEINNWIFKTITYDKYKTVKLNEGEELTVDNSDSNTTTADDYIESSRDIKKGTSHKPKHVKHK